MNANYLLDLTYQQKQIVHLNSSIYRHVLYHLRRIPKNPGKQSGSRKKQVSRMKDANTRTLQDTPLMEKEEVTIQSIKISEPHHPSK